MPILLVRHGEAVAAEHGGDPPRYLTPRGRLETASVARKLREAGFVPTDIVSSPYVRAVQTAEILAHALDHAGVISTDPGLVPDADPSLAARGLFGRRGAVIVVCHEPIVRGLAALLAGTTSHPPFVTSGAVWFGEGTGARPILGRYTP